MKDLIESFLQTSPAQLGSFIREKIDPLNRDRKIRFFREVLKRHLAPRAVITGLRELERLGYRDTTFYEGFLFHADPGVKTQVKRVLSATRAPKPVGLVSLIRLLREGETVDREFMVDNLLSHREPVDGRIVLALLKYDDRTLREQLIRGIEAEHLPDPGILIEALHRGAVWYTRAGIVEILGKLRSESLFDAIDLLIKDRNVEVKLKLIRALERYPRPRVEGYLRKLAEEPLMWVAKEARKLLKSSSG